MTPTMTPTKDLTTQLREFNRWRRCDEAMEQPHPARIGAMIDEAADRLEELELKNQIFRAAQKACEDCDAPRVDRIAELERDLAAEREQVAILRSDEKRLMQFTKTYRLRADEAEAKLEQERQDRKQADLDALRALGERNDARAELAVWKHEVDTLRDQLKAEHETAISLFIELHELKQRES